jgi:biotin operon repressor
MAKAPVSPALARRHLDLGVDYVLRSAGLLWSLFDGDVMRGLVFLSILRIATEDRPVSLSIIARSLRLSPSTARRHVLRLQADGFVVRSKMGGILLGRAFLDRPDVGEALLANSWNLSRMIGALAAPRPPSEPPAIRAVG